MPRILAAAPVDPCLRFPSAVRRVRPGAGGDEPEVGIGRVDGDRPRVVAVAALVGRSPALAGILAERRPAATRLVRPLPCDGVPGERVDVRLRTRTMVLPGRTAVARAHQP